MTTTTIQGKNFLVHPKKESIAMDGDDSGEEIEIDIEDVNMTIERKTCLTNGSTFGDFWSKDKVTSSTDDDISSGQAICTVIAIGGNGETEIGPIHTINGKTGGNKQEFDSDDDEEITKEDVEAIHEQLIKANAILNQQIVQYQDELNQIRDSSIVNRRLNLKKGILQLTEERQKYQQQNKFLKSWCIDKLIKRFHDQVNKNLDKIHSTLRNDSNYIVQSKSLLDASSDPGTKFRSCKAAQTLRTSVYKGNETVDKVKNDLISSLKCRNLDLTHQLEQLKADNPVLPMKGPSIMVIKKEEYLKLLESLRYSSSSSPSSLSSNNNNNDRTKSINCDRSVTQNDKIETIKPKTKSTAKSMAQTNEVKKESIDVTNGDSKRQFYICKCGQQFSKNALGYKAAYDSFRQHVAKCSVYMKNGAVCDICDAPFHSIPCLKVHIRRIHPERPELLEKYRHIVSCPCGKVFDNYSQECTAIKALRKHARACPSYRSKAIFCYICKEPFLEPNQLNNHIRMAHSNKSNGISGGKSSTTVSKPATSGAAKKRKTNPIN